MDDHEVQSDAIPKAPKFNRLKKGDGKKKKDAVR
jgi:hypothetical protein